MNRLLFYYLPEKDAVLAGATEIPLGSINRIYVEHRPQFGQQDQSSKGFTILTKKKAYRLLCDSQLIMEQILFAFSNLIGAQSQKPLYDWNSYYTNEAQESIGSQTHKRSASKEPTFNNKTDYQPAMHQRRGSTVNNRSPVRGVYNSQNSQEYQNPHPAPQKETIIKTQSREMNIVEEKKSLPKVESRNLEPEQPVQQQQISPKNEAEESKPIQENEVERSSSPSQQEKERRSPSKENQQARGRTMGLNQVQNSDHMVEVQSLDQPSKSNSDETKNVPALSSRQLQSFRRSSASRQKAGGLTPTSIPVGRIENTNSVPLKADHESFSNNKLMQISGDARIETSKAIRNEETNNYMSKSDPVSSLSRKPHPGRGAEGYTFSPSEEKRTEEVIDSDMPLSYLDIMKLKKKEKPNPQYQLETNVPSSKYEVKKQINVDDDWDKELFGDGQLSPIRTQKKVDNNLGSYNSQYISQPNQSSAQITKLTGFNERKAVTAVGKTETFAVRGYIHNDWDDDL